MYPTPSPQYLPEPEPETDSDPKTRVQRAPITAVLIAVNIAVFVVELWVAWDGYDAVLFRHNSATFAMIATGGNYWASTIHEARWETLLASCFVHGGLLHIGFNVVAMRQIGPIVERVVGAARMLPLYLISGIVGSFLSTFVNVMRGKEGVGVGASGAICGLIGAALVIGYRVEGTKSPMFRAMASWLATIFVVGWFVADNVAHAGGAIAGCVIAFLWRRGFTYSPARRATVLGLCAVVLLATAARVIVFDLTNPFASFNFANRAYAAEDALRDGNCSGARSATASAKRLKPSAPEIIHLEEALRERCP